MNKYTGCPARNRRDLTGQKFKMLTVLGYSHTKDGRAYWNCRCDCGNECKVSTSSLRKGQISCGCQKYSGSKGLVIDLTGLRFGRLVVLGQEGRTKGGKLLWKCQCDCGNIKYTTRDHLGKDANSCGCLRKEVSANISKTHGESNTRLYNLWCSMRQRCTEGGAERTIYYDRGIRVCDEWQTYEPFRDWALANGYDKTAKRGATTIDRIDNDKGYSPENCRFVTQTENARNKRNIILVTINGETMPLTVAAEITGHSAKLARGRIARGWNPEEAILKPPRKGRYKRSGNNRDENY